MWANSSLIKSLSKLQILSYTQLKDSFNNHLLIYFLWTMQSWTVILKPLQSYLKVRAEQPTLEGVWLILVTSANSNILCTVITAWTQNSVHIPDKDMSQASLLHPQCVWRKEKEKPIFWKCSNQLFEEMIHWTSFKLLAQKHYKKPK